MSTTPAYLQSKRTHATRNRYARFFGLCKAAGLANEEMWRDFLVSRYDKQSLRDLTAKQLSDAMAALTVKAEKNPKTSIKKSKKSDCGMVRKIQALWINLHHMGFVRDASDKALQTFAKRHMTTDHLEWASPGDKNKVIEALKDWVHRETGITFVNAHQVQEDIEAYQHKVLISKGCTFSNVLICVPLIGCEDQHAQHHLDKDIGQRIRQQGQFIWGLSGDNG